MSVLELSELVKTFEEEFGVTAAAPVAVAAAGDVVEVATGCCRSQPYVAIQAKRIIVGVLNFIYNLS